MCSLLFLILDRLLVVPGDGQMVKWCVRLREFLSWLCVPSTLSFLRSTVVVLDVDCSVFRFNPMTFYFWFWCHCISSNEKKHLLKMYANRLLLTVFRMCLCRVSFTNAGSRRAASCTRSIVTAKSIVTSDICALTVERSQRTRALCFRWTVLYLCCQWMEPPVTNLSENSNLLIRRQLQLNLSYSGNDWHQQKLNIWQWYSYLDCRAMVT